MLDGDPAPRQKGAQPPIFGPCLLWQNGWIDQDATWYGGRPWPRRHFIRWGPSSLIYDPCLLWPNGWMDQDATWYGGRPWPSRHCASWEPSSPHEKGTVRLCGFCHTSASGFCVGASRASFINVSGRPFQVTVRPVLRNNSPVYPVCSLCNVVVLWPNGWMDQDAT